MFSTTIKPIINKNVYDSIKALVKDKMESVKCRNLMAYTFIRSLKSFYNMQLIAQFLGVSVRSLYHILENMEDNSKDGLINTFVFHWFNTDSYEHFKARCVILGVRITERI